MKIERSQIANFIREANKEDLEYIKECLNIQQKLASHAQKCQFSIGEVVTINHHKISPDLRFKIEKINRKNIKVSCTSNKFNQYTVSPS